MERKVDMRKAAGILIQDGKFLVTRSKGKSLFIVPGGKIEAGETTSQALVRELREELGITVSIAHLEAFGTFYALAAETADTYLQVDAFIVKSWIGAIAPAQEIEEVRWIDSLPPAEISLGSILINDILPKLKKMTHLN